MVELQREPGSAAPCRAIGYAFRRKDEKEFGTTLTRTLREEASPQTDAFAASSALKLNTEGDLRITLDCAAGARVRLESLWIAAPRFGLYYRIRSQGQPPTPELLLPERP
jgi:hypothetical protein